MKIIDVAHTGISQSQGYYCGPASLRNLNVALMSSPVPTQDEIAAILGTTTNGSLDYPLFQKYMRAQWPAADYRWVPMQASVPSAVTVEAAWKQVTHSIDAGFPVESHVWFRTGSHPVALGDDLNPLPTAIAYGDVRHWLLVNGYKEDNGKRYVHVADSGYQPHLYWWTLEDWARISTDVGYIAAFVELPSISSYRERKWVDKDPKTPLSGARLTEQEGDIKAAADRIADLENELAALRADIAQQVGWKLDVSDADEYVTSNSLARRSSNGVINAAYSPDPGSNQVLVGLNLYYYIAEAKNRAAHGSATKAMAAEVKKHVLDELLALGIITGEKRTERRTALKITTT